jgi:hypothetical protein
MKRILAMAALAAAMLAVPAAPARAEAPSGTTPSHACLPGRNGVAGLFWRGQAAVPTRYMIVRYVSGVGAATA